MMGQKARERDAVGMRLRHVRGSLTQGVFAGRLNAEKNTIGRYERGERQPDALFLKKLQTEFSVSIDWLLGGVGEPYLSSSPQALTTTLDLPLLVMIVAEVLGWFSERGMVMDSELLGERIVVVYDDIRRVVGDSYAPEVPRALLKMAMLQWEREYLGNLSEPH